MQVCNSFLRYTVLTSSEIHRHVLEDVRSVSWNFIPPDFGTVQRLSKESSVVKFFPSIICCCFKLLFRWLNILCKSFSVGTSVCRVSILPCFAEAH